MFEYRLEHASKSPSPEDLIAEKKIIAEVSSYITKEGTYTKEGSIGVETLW